MLKVTEADPEARRFITGRTRPQVNTKKVYILCCNQTCRIIYMGGRPCGFTLTLETVKVPVMGLGAQRSAWLIRHNTEEYYYSRSQRILPAVTYFKH